MGFDSLEIVGERRDIARTGAGRFAISFYAREFRSTVAILKRQRGKRNAKWLRHDFLISEMKYCYLKISILRKNF